jgi:hypothetical protein
MPTNNHLLDFQMRDRILDYACCIEVFRVHRIRYIAVHEDLAGLAVTDGRFGDATICAPDPEDLGRLALREQGEGIGIACGCALPVGAIAG